MTRRNDAGIWYKALYLTERLRLHRQELLAASPPGDKAVQRAQRWRDSFRAGAEVFQRRLACDGIDEQALARMLDAPARDVLDRFVDPPWLARLRAAYDAPAAQPVALPGPMASHRMAGLLNVAWPLLARAHADLTAFANQVWARHASDDPRPPFQPAQLTTQLFAALPLQMMRILSRTLTLEMHVARLSGALMGETAEARYQEFIAGLSEPERAWRIFEEYPVLARCLSELVERWDVVAREFTTRLASDWGELVRTVLDGVSPGELTTIDHGAGDTHRGGRAVMILTFASGARLVYKPRPLRGDVVFQELLAWLDRRGSHPPFRRLRLLDRGDHGWVEFVEYRPCASKEEAARFFERQGAYLALFHALKANDFHYENLIAHGEHPMPVDLETLFHPHASVARTDSSQRAADRISASVLRVGLLPYRNYTVNKEEDVDFSGLSSVKGQLTPEKQLTFEGAGTDALRMVRKRMEMPEGHNLPALDGQELSVLEHEKDFMRGFHGMYRLFVEHRDEIVAEDGPLARFASAPIRVLFRPTRVYSMVFRESFHPDVLRDALDRDRLFDRLWETVQQQPLLERVVTNEIEEMREGDVPMFTSRPETRDVFDGRGVAIPDLLEQSGLERSRARIAGFDDLHLKEQGWFIQSSLATVAMSREDSEMARYPFQLGSREATADELLAAARAVGDRLCELAISGERDAAWIGMTYHHDKWLLAPLETDLYGGLGGIAMFLAYLGERTGVATYTEMAARARYTIGEAVASGSHLLSSPGVFSGWSSIPYLYSHLAVLWDRPDLLDATTPAIDELARMIPEAEGWDVMYGLAGAISGLLTLHRLRPDARLSSLATIAGDRLIAKATRRRRGMAWKVNENDDFALAGFSHGAAGIGWALSHLAAATGEGRFRDAAVAAMEFERDVFSEQRQNWPDLRPPLKPLPPGVAFEQPSLRAWCHGAPGIGMGRLDMPGFEDDAEVAREIDIAVATTRRSGFGGSHCLCHGDLGNLELLLLAAQKRNDAALLSDVYRRARGILDGVAAHGWLSGVPLGVETPGLMTGLAGIGYAFLRLSAPEAVPSVLTLAPPPSYTRPPTR
jgi:type 2 lantibiotic biosynthesis protein LanM